MSASLAAIPIRAVLLDMDGTLVDAFAPIVYALNRTLRDFGRALMSERDIKRHTGRGECSMISLFGAEREEAARHFLRFHDEKLYDISPLPGAEAMLRFLQGRQLPSAIVTSKSQQRAELQLQHLGWRHYFACVVGLEEGRRQKPDPHTIQLACAELDVPPETAVMIGDGTADMKAARRAGALPLGLVGHFSAAEMRDAGAAACFTDLHEVLAWLRERIH
ncbi:MAG: HAD family hydrolase [Zetaproteobacteria bacterium]|nr:MAG: HAD family hydrolase [Zetaproteobacteria bacterium]